MPGPSNQNALQRAMNKILGRRVELLKEQETIETKVVESTKGMTKANKELLKSTKELVTTSTIYKDIAVALTAGALAYKSLDTAVRAANTSQRQWLDTSSGIDNMSTSIQNVAKRAQNYQKIQAGNAKTAWEYGKRLEDVRSISDRWIKTMRYTKSSDANRESLEKLTRQTILYSDVLGIDAAKLQEEAAERMFKYGESHEDAQESIVKTKFQVIALNKSMSDLSPNQAAVFDDDFKQRVDAVAQSTTGYASDLGNVNAIMASAIERGGRLGMTYDQMMDSATSLSKFLTGSGMSENANAMVGIQLMKDFNAALDERGELKQSYLSLHDEETQKQLKQLAIAKKKGLVETIAAGELQRITAQTNTGIDARTKLVDDLTRSGMDATMAFMQLGLSEAEAYQAGQLYSEGGSESLKAEMARNKEKTQVERDKATEKALKRTTQGLTPGGLPMLAADAGTTEANKKIAELTGIDISKRLAEKGINTEGGISGMIGQGMGQFEKSENTMVAAAAVAGGSFLRRKMQERAQSKQEKAEAAQQAAAAQAGLGGGGDTAGYGGAAGGGGSTASAVAAGVSAALERYTEDGNQLRTTGTGGGGSKESILGKIAETMAQSQATKMKLAGGVLSNRWLMKQILSKGAVAATAAGTAGTAATAAVGTAGTAAGAAGTSAVGTAGTVATAGLAATVAGAGATASFVGGLFAAPAAAFGYGIASGNKAENILRRMKSARSASGGFSGPLHTGYGGGIDSSAWLGMAEELAKAPDSVIQGLVSDGTLAPELGTQVMEMKKAKTMAPISSPVGTPNPLSSPAMAGGGGGGSGARNLIGSITNIAPNGTATLTISNALAIAAKYDSEKSKMY